MNSNIAEIVNIVIIVSFLIVCILGHIYFSFKSNRLGFVFPMIAIFLAFIAFPLILVLTPIPLDPEPINKLFWDLNIPTFILLVIYFMCRTIVRKMEKR